MFPSNSLDEISFEFVFGTDRNLYLDLRGTRLSFNYSRDDCLMLSRGKKQNIKQNPTIRSSLHLCKNLLHSLLSNREVCFNNTMAYTANGLYSHKAQISIEFNSSAVSKKRLLAFHGYNFEDFPDAFTKHQFTDRANSRGTGITCSLNGRPALDLITC